MSKLSLNSLKAAVRRLEAFFAKHHIDVSHCNAQHAVAVVHDHRSWQHIIATVGKESESTEKGASLSLEFEEWFQTMLDAAEPTLIERFKGKVKLNPSPEVARNLQQTLREAVQAQVKYSDFARTCEGLALRMEQREVECVARIQEKLYAAAEQAGPSELSLSEGNAEWILKQKGAVLVLGAPGVGKTTLGVANLVASLTEQSPQAGWVVSSGRSLFDRTPVAGRQKRFEVGTRMHWRCGPGEVVALVSIWAEAFGIEPPQIAILERGLESTAAQEFTKGMSSEEVGTALAALGARLGLLAQSGQFSTPACKQFREALQAYLELLGQDNGQSEFSPVDFWAQGGMLASERASTPEQILEEGILSWQWERFLFDQERPHKQPVFWVHEELVRMPKWHIKALTLARQLKYQFIASAQNPDLFFGKDPETLSEFSVALVFRSFAKLNHELLGIAEEVDLANLALGTALVVSLRRDFAPRKVRFSPPPSMSY